MSENRQKYTFRKIKGRDIFKLARFFKKIDTSEIKKFLDDEGSADMLLGSGEETSENKVSKLGGVVLKIVDIVLENMDKLENDFFELITDFSDLSAERIEELELEEFENLVVDFFSMPQLADFLKRMLQRLGLQTIVPQTSTIKTDLEDSMLNPMSAV